MKMYTDHFQTAIGASSGGRAIPMETIPEYEKWMRLALAEAVADENEVPVGAVIVKDGREIARAHNEREGGDPTAHAEILAIRRAARALGTRHLHGCTLFVTLEMCPMCAGAALMAEIDRVVYGARDEKQGCLGSVYALGQDAAFYHRFPAAGGVLEEECARVLREFFERKRSGT